MSLELCKLMQENICRKIVGTALSEGYKVEIDDQCGDEQPVDSPDAAWKILSNVDDAFIIIKKSDSATDYEWVQVVFGNKGWDVISDYSATPELEKLLVHALAATKLYEKHPLRAAEDAIIRRAQESPKFKRALIAAMDKE